MKLYRLLFLLGFLIVCKGEEESGDSESCDNFTDLNLSHCFMGTSLYVRLLLYTRANVHCGRELQHHGSAASDHPLFEPARRPTAFVIHGYRPTGAPPIWIDRLVQLLLAQDDMNVIVVDWNKGAANLNYFTAVTYTRDAALNLTEFIINMQEEGASLNNIHLIGVSLGAHLAGFVGANLKGKIGRITGLDPAGPMFTSAGPDERLDPSDAQFVDVLHTDMDSFGLRGAHGHVDFYANGGADQPGCPKTIFAGKSYFVCDHQRAVFLYLCALNHTCSLTAFPCSSYSDFLDAKCLQCEAFRPAPCPKLGYDFGPWREALIRMGQTKVFFSTTSSLPYRSQCQLSSHIYCVVLTRVFLTVFCPVVLLSRCVVVPLCCCPVVLLSRCVVVPLCPELSYRVDLVTWNQYLRWGVVYIRLHSGRSFTEARVDHKLLRFEQYTSTRLLAEFEDDISTIQKISMRINTGNVIGPRYKIRLLRVRFTPLDQPDRPVMCRFDIIMEENMEVSFRPLPCDPRQ